VTIRQYQRGLKATIASAVRHPGEIAQQEMKLSLTSAKYLYGWAARKADVSAQLPPARLLCESSWNADWVLSRTHNPTNVINGASEGYHFDLAQDGQIRWEIPSFDEVVDGRTDGRQIGIGVSRRWLMYLLTSGLFAPEQSKTRPQELDDA